jgi:hypothetical protein
MARQEKYRKKAIDVISAFCDGVETFEASLFQSYIEYFIPLLCLFYLPAPRALRPRRAVRCAAAILSRQARFVNLGGPPRWRCGQSHIGLIGFFYLLIGNRMLYVWSSAIRRKS